MSAVAVPAAASALAVLNPVARTALGLTGADVAGVLLADGPGEVAEMSACAGRWTVHSANLRVRRGHGLAGRILQTRKPWKVDDYTCDRSIRAEEFMPVLVEEGMLAGLGAPLLAGDTLVGVLMVWSRRRSAFDLTATQALVDLADLAALAVTGVHDAQDARRELATVRRRCAELGERSALAARGAQLRDELTALLLAGRGLPDLLAAVCGHAGGDAVLFDPRLSELGACGAVAPVRERVAPHVRRPDADPDATLPPVPGFPRWTLLRGVDADGARLARLAVCLPRPPTPADHDAAGHAALACALLLTRERAVLDARSRGVADFVGQLLEGLVDESGAVVRARRLGCELPARLRVMAVPVVGEDARLDLLVDVAERLARTAGATVLAGRRGSTLTLVLSAVDDGAAARAVAEHVVRGLRRHAPGAVGVAGVSACVEWSADLRAAHRQARQALAAGDSQGVVLFDELGLLRFLLAPSDRADQRRFAHAVLGPVLDYDREHHTDLVATLGVYLDEGCSLTRAAVTLYVHPKTVRYRLRRVEELAHRDLSGQRDRFDSQLAIAILRALEIDAAPAP